MNRVIVSSLYSPIAELENLDKIFADLDPTSTVSGEQKILLDQVIADIQKNINRPLELRSGDEVNRRISRIVTRLLGFANDAGGRTNAAVWGDVRALKESLEHALDDYLFLCLPKNRAEFWQQESMFGVEVAARFAEANKEITQAGNCYTVRAYTATVFHCMRAVEIATRVLIRRMGARKHLPHALELCTWGDLISALEKGLNDLSKGKRSSPSITARFEFYNHAVGVFRNFKGAWRDNVSHARRSYNSGETKDIIENTRQFMQHLATRLKE